MQVTSITGGLHGRSSRNGITMARSLSLLGTVAALLLHILALFGFAAKRTGRLYAAYDQPVALKDMILASFQTELSKVITENIGVVSVVILLAILTTMVVVATPPGLGTRMKTTLLVGLLATIAPCAAWGFCVAALLPLQVCMSHLVLDGEWIEDRMFTFLATSVLFVSSLLALHWLRRSGVHVSERGPIWGR